MADILRQFFDGEDRIFPNFNFPYRESIDGTADLKTYTKSGHYKVPANTTATNLYNKYTGNCPTELAFIMDVYSSNGTDPNGSYMCQEIHNYKGDIWRRFTDNATAVTPTWTNWAKVGAGIIYERVSDNTAQFSDYEGNIYPVSGCRKLKSNTNLNNITDSGNFYYANDITVTNKPSGTGAYGIVISTRYGSAGCQILFDLTNSEMYFRTYGNSWSSWKKVTYG